MSTIEITFTWRARVRPIREDERAQFPEATRGNTVAILDSDAFVLAWCHDEQHARSQMVHWLTEECPFADLLVRS